MIKILSMEECQSVYGKTLVQYQAGDIVSFAFTNIDIANDADGTNKFINEVLDGFHRKPYLPLWSDLSKTLRDEIIESAFDMHFIEYDNENWNAEKADKIYEEANRLHFGGTITRDDDCYLTFYAGAMGEVNWCGHPYFGQPYLENIPIPSEKIQELKNSDDIYEYHDSFGDLYYVSFNMNIYADNDNLYLGLLNYNPEFDAMEPYCDITVNTISLPYLCSTIDTNNNGSALIPFLVENGLGELTGKTVPSGFCNFPVFKFSEEKLKEICPEEFLVYQKAHGKLKQLDERIEDSRLSRETSGEDNKQISVDKER